MVASTEAMLQIKLDTWALLQWLCIAACLRATHSEKLKTQQHRLCRSGQTTVGPTLERGLQLLPSIQRSNSMCTAQPCTGLQLKWPAAAEEPARHLKKAVGTCQPMLCMLHLTDTS